MPNSDTNNTNNQGVLRLPIRGGKCQVMGLPSRVKVSG